MSCQSCEGCNRCNSCQGCHGCNTCNSCLTCNTCQGCVNCNVCNRNCNGPSNGCLDCESFCETGYQIVSNRVGKFSWGVSTAKDAKFFSLNTWNKIITYINRAYSAGSKSSVSNGSYISKDTNTFMTAEKFNEVSDALFSLGGNNSNYNQRTVYAVGSSKKPDGDIIYGSYFVELVDQANKLKYKRSQCDECNTACNNCDECEGCNICQSCNICQTGNKCRTSNTRNGKCNSRNTSYACCESTSGDK